MPEVPKNVPVVELDTIRASDAPGPGSSPGGHTKKKTCRMASLFSGLPPLLGRENGGFGGERNRRVRKIAERFLNRP